jgi:cytoskeletal protein CcmA (bactofilin family)
MMQPTGFLGYRRAVGKSTTLIAKRTRVGGRIETDGDVVVEGRVEGAVVAAGRVTIAESGMAVAQIQAARVEVEGVVIGDVVATERIGVAAGARVVGDLRAPEVSLASGAVVEGKVDRRAADRRNGWVQPASPTREPSDHDEHAEDHASTWVPEPVTEPRGRTTLRDGGIPLVRPGRPAARPAAPVVGAAPPRLPRPVARAKLVLRRRSTKPS